MSSQYFLIKHFVWRHIFHYQEVYNLGKLVTYCIKKSKAIQKGRMQGKKQKELTGCRGYFWVGSETVGGKKKLHRFHFTGRKEK
jgi:hypothetical protein